MNDMNGLPLHAATPTSERLNAGPILRMQSIKQAFASPMDSMQQCRRRAMAWLAKSLPSSGGKPVERCGLPSAGIQRILISRPNHRLGNTVMITSLMAELESQFPGAEIDVLSAGEAARSIFCGFSSLGTLHLLDRRAIRHPVATFMTIAKLRAKGYDLVIDAAVGSSSGKIAANLANARYHLQIDAIDRNFPSHFADRPVHALRVASNKNLGAPMPALDLRLSPSELQIGRTTLQRVLTATNEALPVLVVFPNATGSKRYDEGWWTNFLDALLQTIGPHRVIELIAADGLSRLSNRYPTYFTSNARRLAALIDAAGLYISADCGVMHLASSTRATTIGLFCKTDPNSYAPCGGNNAGFVTRDLAPEQIAQQVGSHLRIRHGSDAAARRTNA